jgi:hypothetical protein
MNITNITRVAGGFLGGAGKIDNIVKAAKGLLCLPSLLSQFKAADIKNLLKGMAGFAAAMAANILDSVVGAVADTINNMLNTALAPLRLLQSYVKSLLNVVDNISNIYKNLKKKSLDLRDFTMNQQNCNVLAADFMNCLLTSIANKVNKKVLSKLQNPLKKVDAQLNKLHKEIAAEAFKAGGLMEQYVGRNLRAAEKLSKQLEIMTR